MFKTADYNTFSLFLSFLQRFSVLLCYKSFTNIRQLKIQPQTIQFVWLHFFFVGRIHNALITKLYFNNIIRGCFPIRFTQIFFQEAKLRRVFVLSMQAADALPGGQFCPPLIQAGRFVTS